MQSQRIVWRMLATGICRSFWINIVSVSFSGEVRVFPPWHVASSFQFTSNAVWIAKLTKASPFTLLKEVCYVDLINKQRWEVLWIWLYRRSKCGWKSSADVLVNGGSAEWILKNNEWGETLMNSWEFRKMSISFFQCTVDTYWWDIWHWHSISRILLLSGKLGIFKYSGLFIEHSQKLRGCKQAWICINWGKPIRLFSNLTFILKIANR
jgi:hypothetical protein